MKIPAMLFYVSLSSIALLLQGAGEYYSTTEPFSLIAVGTVFSLFSGLVSYFWRKGRGKKVDVATSLMIAGFVGLVVGLLTFHMFVVERQSRFFWLAIVLISSFSASVLLVLFDVIVEDRVIKLTGLDPKKVEKAKVEYGVGAEDVIIETFEQAETELDKTE